MFLKLKNSENISKIHLKMAVAAVGCRFCFLCVVAALLIIASPSPAIPPVATTTTRRASPALPTGKGTSQMAERMRLQSI